MLNSLVIGLGATFAWPVVAEDEQPSSYYAPSDSIDSESYGLEKTLEHNFSPEDRARLRKALADYARHNDPEHKQIERKRKEMKANIAKRFHECNLDNDDSLDRDETTQCLPQIARHFSYVDVDGDFVITLAELELAHSKSVQRRKEAEARLEAELIKQEEARINAESKRKLNKQAANVTQ